MTAAAIESEPIPQASAGHLSVAERQPSLRDDAEAREVARSRAEGAVFHDALVGAIVGVLLLAPSWAGLVVLALRGSGTALWPPALMGAGVGVIAGVFMGGSAGTLLGSRTLEHFEHETRRPAPGAAPKG